VNAVVTAWGVYPGSFLLAQQCAILVVVTVAAVAATYGVFRWLQVTDFDFDGFLLHFSFPFLSCFVVSESHFWLFTEVVRKIEREVTRKSDEPTVKTSS
jgi:hypothetical protein